MIVIMVKRCVKTRSSKAPMVKSRRLGSPIPAIPVGRSTEVAKIPLKFSGKLKLFYWRLLYDIHRITEIYHTPIISYPAFFTHHWFWPTAAHIWFSIEISGLGNASSSGSPRWSRSGILWCLKTLIGFTQQKIWICLKIRYPKIPIELA